MTSQSQPQSGLKAKPSKKKARPNRYAQRSRQRRSADQNAILPRENTPTTVETPTSMEPEAFAKLGLGPWSLAAVRRIGFETPTGIQEKFIPAALTGRDSVGLARTGTGKTVAFLLPIFEQIYQGGSSRALVLAPTRELAQQISDESQKLSGKAAPQTTAVYGGIPIKQQIQKLRGKPDVIVATPGRLIDHSRRKTLDFSEFSVVVLDEVDRMFDMGFRKDISHIMDKCLNRTQTLFLSATMPQDIMRFADRFLHNPIRVSAIDGHSPSVETLDQRYFAVAEGRKLLLLIEVLEREKPELGLIFTRTKRGAEKLGKELQRRGYDAMYIHGDLTQSRRKKAMDSFRARKIQFLVATDVMGRGIDVPGVSHVINYNIPENPKDYLHRVGRSGRMNAPGKAFTFVTPAQGGEINAIETLCRHLLDKDSIPGFDNGIRRR